jgi:transcriptional regulator with XRE-family HTH domain
MGGEKMRHFGRSVRELRETRKLKQVDCAARAGMKPQQWNYMEKNTERPQLSTVEAVARGVDMSPSEVLDSTGFNQALDVDTMYLRELNDLISRASADKRHTIKRAIREHAETLVSLAS